MTEFKLPMQCCQMCTWEDMCNQFSLFTQSCLTLCDPMNYSMTCLSITSSWSLPKPMSIESVMPSNHLILCHPLLLLPSIFPITRAFSNESALRIRWPRFGISASTSVLPMNTEDWSPLEQIGLIFLQSKGPSSLPTPQFKSISSSVLSLLYSTTLTSKHDH